MTRAYSFSFRGLRRSMVLFAEAQMSATVASAADFGLTLLLSECVGVWYAYATALGAVCGGVVNCTVNYRWVFPHEGRRRRTVAWRYLLVWCVSIVLNTCGTCLVTEALHVNYIVSKTLVACLVATLWNYQMQRIFVFTKRIQS